MESIMTKVSTHRLLRTRVCLLAIAVASAGLAGCDSMLGDRQEHFDAGQQLLTPAERHPIIVSQQPHKMSVKVARGAAGLAPGQKAAVIDFLTRYRAADAGNSKLIISVPSGSANEVSAMNAVADMRPLMADQGFPESSISIEPYHAEGDPQPPVRISYLRYAAEGPTCGKWPSNVAETTRNVNYENFGCATQKNLAAMVANPADLLGPRTMTPASADRRDVTWGEYVKGRPSGSNRNTDERVTK
jgi:pilus assembly protein CpaD